MCYFVPENDVCGGMAKCFRLVVCGKDALNQCPKRVAAMYHAGLQVGIIYVDLQRAEDQVRGCTYLDIAKSRRGKDLQWQPPLAHVILCGDILSGQFLL